jgi:hypothetical protein
VGPNAGVDYIVYNLTLCPLQSRLQVNTFTMGLWATLPESTLTLCQSRVDFIPPVREFGFDLTKKEEERAHGIQGGERGASSPSNSILKVLSNDTGGGV